MLLYAIRLTMGCSIIQIHTVCDVQLRLSTSDAVICAVGSVMAGHYCDVCWQDATKWCAQCKTVYYCSRLCQVKGWPGHRSLCRTIAAGSRPKWELPVVAVSPPLARTVAAVRSNFGYDPAALATTVPAVSPPLATTVAAVRSNFGYGSATLATSAAHDATTKDHASAAASNLPTQDMRAPTADELDRLMQWASRALGEPVKDIAFGTTRATSMFLAEVLKDAACGWRLSAREILGMAYARTTQSIKMDCALAAILLKAYADDDPTMVDFFPAVCRVPGNKAAAVTTTLTEDPHCALRAECSLICAVQWIVPMADGNGAVEWWGLTQEGFRIAPSKETWGALMATIHQELRLSSTDALRATLKHHWNYTEQQFQDLSSVEAAMVIAHSKLVNCYASRFKGPIEAVYQ